jgi:hypothetical protein
VIETPDAQYRTLPASFQYARFRATEMEGFSRFPEYELDSNFLRTAADKDDECHAILAGDTLASYGWYSKKPTGINDELELDFDRNYVYMYKGFTHGSFRGHRLHAIGMTLALAQYRAAGRKGLLSYIESQNYDSLKSCYRMGYRPCGQIRFFAVRGKYVIVPSVECRSFGLRLYHVAASDRHNHYRARVNNG